jgi:hypothetical protein
MVSAVPQWAALGLFEPSGRQIVNTLAPLGAELPATTAPEVVRRVADARQSEIRTRADDGGLTVGHTVVIYMPVVREAACATSLRQACAPPWCSRSPSSRSTIPVCSPW